VTLSSTTRYTVLKLGKRSPADAYWTRSSTFDRVLRFEHCAASGRRLNSLVWGLGVDALILAIKSLFADCHGPYLALSPWMAVGLRLTGRRNFVVTGIFAVPGSRAWRCLRSFIGSKLVITTVAIEANNWNRDGGRAVSVLYGNTFGYKMRTSGQQRSFRRIFIGGSSDRDLDVIDQLLDELRSSDICVELTICVGLAAEERCIGDSTVTSYPWVSYEEFGELMQTTDVVFLPLLNKSRAAGHMVAVQALESGIPVVASDTSGMREYFDVFGIQPLDSRQPVLDQLLAAADHFHESAQELRAAWEAHLSLAAYIRRVELHLADVAGKHA
jgi:glycosyltransferase involved in cell wall biosynthesis